MLVRVSHETVRTVLTPALAGGAREKRTQAVAKGEVLYSSMCQMEEVLDVYKRPYDPKRPQICMDEMPTQLLAEKYDPLPCRAGHIVKQDYEYERKRTANLFMLFEPLTGKRYIPTSAHRTAVDGAQVMKILSDERYPEAETIVWVMDNLNTHKRASFYEAFEPEEAHRLTVRDSLHTQARELVEHGRDRVECSGASMSQPSSSRSRNS